jgi:amidase
MFDFGIHSTRLTREGKSKLLSRTLLALSTPASMTYRLECHLMSDLVFTPAHKLAQMIRQGELSAVEVLEAYLQQISRQNPRLNAIVTLDEVGARKQAQSADAALKRGEVVGPLHGVPITVKDLLETEGLRTTCGFPPLADYHPKRDATGVARLRQAGAVILGKTNVPALGQDIQTYNPLFGRTNNPWDLKRTPGGSTGGGAAAVAAGCSALDLGSDLGGSLRIPAHFCGVYGFKPTEHRVSAARTVGEQLGHPRSLRNMLTIGPIARSVEDLQLCLSLLEGADQLHWEVPPAVQELFNHRPLKDYRLAFTNNFDETPISSETREVLKRVVLRLKEQGCQVEAASPTSFSFSHAWQTYGEISSCEMSVSQKGWMRFLTANLGRLLPLERVGPIVQGVIRGAGYGVQDYLKALAQRDAFIQQMEYFLSHWDAWMCPVTSGPAFHHYPKPGIFGSLDVDGKPLPYWVWGTAHTSIFNLTGNPVVVLPFGQTETGLPIGLQLVGQRWQDRKLLDLAQKISTAFEPLLHPPEH